MLNLFFRLLLTANATFWMVVVYGIKEQWSYRIFSPGIISAILILIPVILSLVLLLCSKAFDQDSIQNCKECVLADNEFLPVYLGYFFVALSINNLTTLCYIYAIVFVFTFVTQAQYFNPAFLLFGYHFYHVTTMRSTKVFVIAKGTVIRNEQYVGFDKLRRINNTTYISGKD